MDFDLSPVVATLKEQDQGAPIDLAGAYTALNCALGDLLGENRAGTAAAGAVVANFCAVAMAQKWAYHLFVKDAELTKWQSLWKTQSKAKVFMICQQQLNQAYFNHRVSGFIHAWHMVLKWLVCEEGVAPATLIKQADGFLTQSAEGFTQD